ncbi:diphthine methyltransferase isoform X2 [Tribolium madens]|uniref:diphthine methyltransferase isoform X2 n=1 Tax=Tribolium madens TaxID=41895 RepID=UPI001CF73B69|nr:diphthine methyltransferase isoform X2 [Tribolium madens]
MCDDKPPCRQITTLHTYSTEYNADSVEWCPHEPHQTVFVCANYQLNSETGKRIGCILLFSATADALILHQKIETAAILDQKWCHNKINNSSILGVVNAQQTLEIYALKSDNVKLEFVTSFQLDDDGSETLFLSLDWSTGKFASDEPEIVVSDSKGAIHRFKLRNSELIKAESWHGHEFEAWISAFYYWDPNIVFSGDDCRFLKFDKRVGLEPLSCNKSHEAGVTSMHSNAQKEYILATGSYDANARLWDIRHLKNCVSSVQMPGPLWRLKWDPHDRKYLLAACMLGGVHIIDSQNANLEIIDSYYQHKNIAYGVDWSHLPVNNSTNETLIGSCSFYDNLLCVSKVKFDK